MYHQLLYEELRTLWDGPPVKVWDAYMREYFDLKALLFVTVQDYPALGYQSGQVVHGYKDCVLCKEHIATHRLAGSSKIVYMGHRRWLKDTDEWRQDEELFDNTVEIRSPPCKLGGKRINEMLKNWKECPAAGKMQKKVEPLHGVWKLRSVFWDLPYWKHLDTRHCIDIMHIEKMSVIACLDYCSTWQTRQKMGIIHEWT